MTGRKTEHIEMQLQVDQDTPLRESVYNTLRKNILIGKLKPGEHLTEIRLGKMLGTSRTPIREAIRKLELDGLVVIVPRSGARVAPISERDLREVLEVRRALDVLCAELASRRITGEEKITLKEAYERFEVAAKEGDQLEVAKADVELHDIIAAAAGNERLLQLVGGIADQIYRYRFEYIKDDYHYDRLLREHKAIVNAIIAGDAEKAAEASRVHIDNQEKTILAQLRQLKV
ncbi:MAG: GntR family transcriptional regulator [Lachnospiraceae bacterium]|nr:GntR family transcriptional regulator [Lachnospiraceae bacterium]MBP3736019.1 GntR family transcriptional regulator [Lachnospiraceae bacterium]